MITRRTALAFLVAAATAAAAGAAFAAERVPFDRAAFDAAVKAGGPVLVDVSATWCPTCHAQEAVLADLMKSPPYDAFKTFVVDYDTQKDIMRSFGTQQRSTLIVYKGGAEVGRLTGATRADVIEALLAKAV
jgi:thioredoxin 1